MKRSIGSVSINLGDTNRDESMCISVIGGVFIHGTYAEMREFANEILSEVAARDTAAVAS